MLRVEPLSAHVSEPDLGMPSIDVPLPATVFDDYATAQATFEQDIAQTG